MPIRIKDRATISEDFEKGLKLVAMSKLEQVKLDADRAFNDGMRKKTFKDNALAIRYSRKMLNEPEFIDKEITKLRSLPYSEYGMRKLDGSVFVHGRTNTVVIRSGRYKWDLGEFDIFFKLRDGGLAQPLMISVRDPSVAHPHPHFNVHRNSGSMLRWEMSICWGGFGPLVSNLMRDANVPEFFRIISTYLHRYASGDTLGGRVEHIRSARLI